MRSAPPRVVSWGHEMLVNLLLLMKLRLPVWVEVRLGSKCAQGELVATEVGRAVDGSEGRQADAREVVDGHVGDPGELVERHVKAVAVGEEVHRVAEVEEWASHWFRRWQLLMSRSTSVVTPMLSRLLRKVSLMTMDWAFVTPGVPKVRVSRAVRSVQLMEPTVWRDRADSEARGQVGQLELAGNGVEEVGRNSGVQGAGARQCSCR